MPIFNTPMVIHPHEISSSHLSLLATVYQSLQAAPTISNTSLSSKSIVLASSSTTRSFVIQYFVDAIPLAHHIPSGQVGYRPDASWVCPIISEDQPKFSFRQFDARYIVRLDISVWSEYRKNLPQPWREQSPVPRELCPGY